MIIALVLSGFFIYDVAFSKKPVLNYRNYRGNCCEIKSEEIKEELPEGAKELKYEIDTGAVEFRVDGGTDLLVTGVHKSNFTTLKKETDSEGDLSILNIETPARGMGYRFWERDSFINSFNLKLNQNLPISLDVDSGASTLDFNLSDLLVKKVGIKAGASTIYTKLGEKTENGAKLEYDCGASTIKLDIPKNYGVKVIYLAGLTSKNLPGFTDEGENTFLSENYQTAEKKIEVVVKAGLSTLEISRY